jgi:hypothetical protein
MKSRVSRSITLGLSLVLSSTAWAKPFTKADVEGKTICFSTVTNKFSPGGKVYNNVAGNGTWSIGKDGVLKISFPSGPFAGVYRDLGGGSIEYTGSWTGTDKLTVVGGYCN